MNLGRNNVVAAKLSCNNYQNKNRLWWFLAQIALVTGTVIGTNFNSRAMALTFNWQFTTDNNSTDGGGNVVSGTIDGLVEGNNSGAGLTINVISSPPQSDPMTTDPLTGTGWIFVDSGVSQNAFVVTNGQVTFANAFFNRASSTQELFFGGYGSNYIANLRDIDFVDDWQNASQPTNFTAVPYDVDSSLGLLLLVGASGVNYLVKRWWLKNKKSVE